MLCKEFAPHRKRAHFRLVQRNKRFEPSLLVIPVGSVVDFPNADPWFHNVFSLYRGKRFDLGLYQAGSQRSVKFDRIGPSYLFCNIHPEMTGVVLAIDSEFFGISDKAGHYSIAGVPPGKYLLHVWYENAQAGSAPGVATHRSYRRGQSGSVGNRSSGREADADRAQEQVRPGVRSRHAEDRLLKTLPQQQGLRIALWNAVACYRFCG